MSDKKYVLTNGKGRRLVGAGEFTNLPEAKKMVKWLKDNVDGEMSVVVEGFVETSTPCSCCGKKSTLRVVESAVEKIPDVQILCTHCYHNCRHDMTIDGKCIHVHNEPSKPEPEPLNRYDIKPWERGD